MRPVEPQTGIGHNRDFVQLKGYNIATLIRRLKNAQKEME